VGSFAADHRPVRAVDPLPADLAQRVCEPLRGRAIVFGGLRSRLGVKNRAEGGQERFAGLRVEVTVDTDHPQVRRGGVQPPPRTCRVLTPQVVSVIDLLTPEADHKLQVAIA
jgi:hypothetical protein